MPDLDAIAISFVRSQRVEGSDELTHVGGTLADGTRWLSTVEEAITAIEGGQRYFVELQSESILVSVKHDTRGRKILRVGFDTNSTRLLALPRGAGAATERLDTSPRVRRGTRTPARQHDRRGERPASARRR